MAGKVQHRILNGKMKKQAYDLEERLLEYSVRPERLKDILEETEELIKIFADSIKTAEKKQK